MSLSKKRHIQESNRILEKRFLFEAPIDPLVKDLAFKLEPYLTGNTKQELVNLKNKPEQSRKEQMDLIRIVDNWCSTTGGEKQLAYTEISKLLNLNPPDSIETICMKAYNQSSGENDGPGGLFGFRYS